ncbi:MAG: GDSL-type esterase/lipase family protein [Erysipelotrichaceae bacterium]
MKQNYIDNLHDYQIEEVQHVINQCNMNNYNKTIFIGDSIIKKWNNINYINCGICGATTETLLLINQEIANIKPKEIYMLIGTNDFSDHYQTPFLEVSFNIYKLIEILQNKIKDVKINIISVLPIIEDKQNSIMKTNSVIRMLNKELLGLEKELDNVKYLDIAKYFIDDKGSLKEEYSLDGLHINKEGYLMFEKVLSL